MTGDFATPHFSADLPLGCLQKEKSGYHLLHIRLES